MIKIAVDAMGGDNAPSEIVKGAVEAVSERPDITVCLTGQEDIIKKSWKNILIKKNRSRSSRPPRSLRLETPGQRHPEEKGFFHCGGNEPGKARRGRRLCFRRKLRSHFSGRPGDRGKDQRCRAASAGSSDPHGKGFSLLIDCGANVDARPSHLVQFAQMGSIYMEHVMGVKRPQVAIVNIGAEEEKGNALVKETFPLLKECPGINFIGSIEAREIPHGGADVIVCEAFVGNVILKLYEGVGATMISMIKKGMISSLRSKIGALLIKPALKSTLKSFDASQYGGAPLLGLKGLVVKTHGSSKANEVKNSIIQCIAFKEQAISEKIGQCLSPREEDIKEP